MKLRRMMCAGVMAAATLWGAASVQDAHAEQPVETAQSGDVIPSRDFDALLEEVQRSRRGSEQLELIEIMAESYRFDARQARELVLAVKSRDQAEAAIILHPRLDNPRKFFIVLAALEEDDREEVRKKLRLDDDEDDNVKVDRGKTDEKSVVVAPGADAPEPMSKDDFKAFKKGLKKVAKDDDDASDAARLTLLEFTIDDNFFTSEQARELVEMMKRSDSKVEVAAMIFPRVTNPEKYFLVLAALDSDTDRKLVQRLVDDKYGDKEFAKDVIGDINVADMAADGKTVTPRPDRKSDVKTGVDGKTGGEGGGEKKHTKPKAKKMSDAAFLDFKKQVAGESFSDDKINLVRMVAANAYFSSAQVRELLDVFSFEDDKVEVAVILYPRTTDPTYYYKVFEAFTFSSSKDELRERLGL